MGEEYIWRRESTLPPTMVINVVGKGSGSLDQHGMNSEGLTGFLRACFFSGQDRPQAPCGRDVCAHWEAVYWAHGDFDGQLCRGRDGRRSYIWGPYLGHAQSLGRLPQVGPVPLRPDDYLLFESYLEHSNGNHPNYGRGSIKGKDDARSDVKALRRRRTMMGPRSKGIYPNIHLKQRITVGKGRVYIS